MPISLQLGNAALVLLCKFIGVPSFAGSSAVRQSKTILVRSCEAQLQLSIRVVERNHALNVADRIENPNRAWAKARANRSVTKTDLSPVPLDKSTIQSVTPSQICEWEGLGPDVELTSTTERMPSEQKWYALTGRVVDAKVEADRDIHIVLVDATGNGVGTVSAEIPVGPQWCEIRQTVFSWTTRKFPFNVKTAHTLKIHEPHVITVTGKAFYDIGHAPADHSNRRTTPKDYAVWEIHPVMALHVD
jgi:hypothetical protein